MAGRYPFHFHRLGNAPASYVQDCSIWKSFYRCLSIHATNRARLSRTVAFDITGSCFYLEDGIEEENIFEYNLAAFVHPIGTPARSEDTNGDQDGVTVCTECSTGVDRNYKSWELLIPSDIAASGFYISNAYNRVIGNAASGGWAGFGFPNFKVEPSTAFKSTPLFNFFLCMFL